MLNVSNQNIWLKHKLMRRSQLVFLLGFLLLGLLYIRFLYFHSNGQSPSSNNASAASSVTLSEDEEIENSRLRRYVAQLERRIVQLERQFEDKHDSKLELALAPSSEISKKTFPSVKYRSDKDRLRILVTGGAGFVGSHLVDTLMKDGHEVTVIDNFFTGRKRNVRHWLGHDNFELIHHDVINPLMIEVNQIYHLASPASPPHYMLNPVKTVKCNTVGTVNMLGLARRVKARLLFASTSEIYGDPEQHPQKETYWGNVNSIGPRACYDESKRVGETLCYAYKKQEDVDVRVARIFNTYGPRMHMNDGRVVSNFILQALQNESITIYGGGAQTRSFQYVSDLVSGLIALMNSNYSLPVNLGNTEEHTIKEFADIIRTRVGSSSKLVNMPALVDDPHRRRPDTNRAKQILSWQPTVSLKEGLEETVEYFRNELSLIASTSNNSP